MYNKNIDSQDVKSFNHAVGELQSLGTLESLGSREPSAIFSPYQKKVSLPVELLIKAWMRCANPNSPVKKLVNH